MGDISINAKKEDRTVLIVDIPALPKEKQAEIDAFNQALQNAYELFYASMGVPARFWVNEKDAPEEIKEINGIKVERRHGCIRGKIMVL